ncbi:hypothetical protein EVAR_82327_1 [Eumeta japonica]|uniref:Uncharacterized protein n=1 Tax=Eumeta variegata TaxID=151549 RepID=A0A4C1UB67_EUMVA|nr:hypothetical protein EVAR_82327_1 [Eumeta japonica]
MEIVLEAVVVQALGPSSGPEILIFKRFRSAWPSIDQLTGRQRPRSANTSPATPVPPASPPPLPAVFAAGSNIAYCTAGRAARTLWARSRARANIYSSTLSAKSFSFSLIFSNPSTEWSRNATSSWFLNPQYCASPRTRAAHSSPSLFNLHLVVVLTCKIYIFLQKGSSSPEGNINSLIIRQVSSVKDVRRLARRRSPLLSVFRVSGGAAGDAALQSRRSVNVGDNPPLMRCKARAPRPRPAPAAACPLDRLLRYHLTDLQRQISHNHYKLESEHRKDVQTYLRPQYDVTRRTPWGFSWHESKISRLANPRSRASIMISPLKNIGFVNETISQDMYFSYRSVLPINKKKPRHFNTEEEATSQRHFIIEEEATSFQYRRRSHVISIQKKKLRRNVVLIKKKKLRSNVVLIKKKKPRRFIIEEEATSFQYRRRSYIATSFQ